MSDKYLELANSKLGKSLLSVVGLPEPVALHRNSEDAPHRVDLAIRTGAAMGAAFAEQISSTLAATEVQLISEDEDCKSSLIFDASGISSVEQSAQLYHFFQKFLPKLSLCGRIVVIGHKPSALENAEHATLQRGLVGFVKSVAKEIGRKGATANLLYVDRGGENAIAAPLRFLLSPGSAFTNAQVLVVSSPLGAMECDWVRPLNGKLVVVTGAARGIGRAISQVLARDGARVIGIDIESSKSELEEAMAEIEGYVLNLDITAQNAPQQLIEVCCQQGGKLHGIVHNAGITRDKICLLYTSTLPTTPYV